jgi:hypothetical protein
MQTLSTTLDGIRDLIKDTDETSFDPAAEAAVLHALQAAQYGFDPFAKLRFRSSTNVEDSDQFTGAGLYDSYSGCLADELDADSSGPSHCDPEQSSERGVFRAIRKVFASIYNLNAYLERLRHGIDEATIGMAILVHHSFPDEIELANGVGRLDRWTYSDSAYLVTQMGSSSVTNPEPGAIPEEVQVSISSGGEHIWPSLMRSSNLVPLGDTVMVFPGEYEALTRLLLAVADPYESASGLQEFTLEFEYKKIAPGDDLVVKQVRRIPHPDSVASVTPFLINEPVEYCLLQGEYGEVFANHRLKSRWSFETRNMWLTEANLQTSLFTESATEYAEACQVYQQPGTLSAWPQASHAFADGSSTDRWSFAELQNPRAYELTVQNVPTLVAPSVNPLYVLTDFACLYLKVDYATPVPMWEWTGPTTTTTDYALLCACPEGHPGDLLQQRFFGDGAGVTVETTYYWPPYPEGLAVGYTAPAIRFVETLISGLTSTPILLQSEYSQTYRPEHHNFSEHFLYEPALDPGLSQQQLDELELAGVRAIHAFTDQPLTTYDTAGWGGVCLDCTGFDGDRDGYCTGEPTFDCDDSDFAIWATPGEVRQVVFIDDQSLAWATPLDPGGSVVVYDTLRSPHAGDFLGDAVCIESDDGADESAVDPDDPGIHSAFFYLVRAGNDCPDGDGSLGEGSHGGPRQGVSCP